MQQQIINIKREIWEGEHGSKSKREREKDKCFMWTKKKRFGEVDHIIKIYYWILLKDWRAYRVIFRHIHWLFRVYSKTLYQYAVLSSLSMIIRESMRLLRRIRDIKLLSRLLKCIQCDIIIDEPKNWEKKVRFEQDTVNIAALFSVIELLFASYGLFFRISSIDVVMICLFCWKETKKSTKFCKYA